MQNQNVLVLFFPPTPLPAKYKHNFVEVSPTVKLEHGGGAGESGRLEEERRSLLCTNTKKKKDKKVSL